MSETIKDMINGRGRASYTMGVKEERVPLSDAWFEAPKIEPTSDVTVIPAKPYAVVEPSLTEGWFASYKQKIRVLQI